MIELKVSGMSCGGCVTSVKKAINRLYPEANVEVELTTGRVTVAAEGASLDVSRIDNAIRQAGFGVEAK